MKLFTALLAFTLLGCPGTVPTPTPVPAPVAEPLDTDPESADACASAEKNLLALECKDSDGNLLGGQSKAGVPFQFVCQNAMKNKVDLNPSCMAAAKSCDEVNKCPR